MLNSVNISFYFLFFTNNTAEISRSTEQMTVFSRNTNREQPLPESPAEAAPIKVLPFYPLCKRAMITKISFIL